MVAPAIAAALGLGERQGRSEEDNVLGWVAPRETLLVLDNCEHLLDGMPGLLERLLAGSPRLSVLVTSRARLLVPFEWVFPVPGLSVEAGLAGQFREGWEQAGRPRAGNLTRGAYATATVHGLRGDDEGRAAWLGIVDALATPGRPLSSMHFNEFFDALLLLHRGEAEVAVGRLLTPPEQFREWADRGQRGLATVPFGPSQGKPRNCMPPGEPGWASARRKHLRRRAGWPRRLAAGQRRAVRLRRRGGGRRGRPGC